MTKLEEVGAERLSVLVPIVRRQPRPMRTGSIVRVSYVHRRRRFRFVSEVMGHSPDGTHDHLSAPAVIEDSERRSHFRLETALQPKSLFPLIVDASTAGPREIDATVVDLSEGGCCLSTRTRMAPGERYGMELDLPGADTITARLRVIGVDEPGKGRKTYRVHALFTDMPLVHCDRIARYLMRRQLEMRRRGQL